MGWCSGTSIFDNVARYILKSNLSEVDKINCLRVLADAMENEDWDCQSDSDYWDDPIVRKVFVGLHPDWEWLEDSE